MKVTRIAPASQGLVRFESTMTYGQLLSVRAFRPEALAVINKNDEVIFSLSPDSASKVGVYGMSISPRDMDETITFVAKFVDRSEEEVVALAAGAKTHINTIEKQVTKALAAFETAKEDIKEV